MTASASAAARGLLVSFEGGEGSGKSTQAKLLAEHLQAAGHQCLLLREPGGTPLGEEVRRLLLQRRAPMTVEAELFLFLAARSELVRSLVRPALAQGQHVICDRFTDSTLAYQGYGRGLDLEQVRHLSSFAADGLTPDLTILLDVPIEVGRGRTQPDDAFHREDDAFHARVREGYLALAAAEGERWLVLDGRLSIEELSRAVWLAVEERLVRLGLPAG